MGKPKHGNNKACYILLSINETLQLTDPNSVSPNFHYVDYNSESVIRHIKEAGLSGAYDNLIRNGE